MIAHIDLGKRAFQFYHKTITGDDTGFEVFHAHQGIEFLYVHEGSGQVIVNQTKIAFGAGTLMVFQPFQLHKIMFDIAGSRRYIRTIFVFDPIAFEPFIQAYPSLNRIYQTLWKGRQMSHIYPVREETAAIIQYEINSFNESLCLSHLKSQDEESALFIATMLKLMRKEIGGFGEVDETAIRAEHHVEKMMEWIEMRFREPFSLERLSMDMHLSPFYASRLFLKETGSNIQEYIIARRMREAIWLLTTTSASIGEIGRRSGFNSPSYFCKLFREQTGVTPRQYRLSFRQLHGLQTL